MSEIMDLNKEKNKNYLSYNSILQINDKKLNKENKKVTLLKVIENIINDYILKGKQDKLEYFIPLGRFKIKDGSKLYSIKFKRILLKQFNNNKTFKNNFDLNKTEIYDINSTYKINMKVNLNNSENNLIPNYLENDSSLNGNLYNYKFIFTLITNNRNLERKKVERIYQNLILTKVSHEFNTPVYFIQDLMDKLIKEKEDNEEKGIYSSKRPLITIEEVKSNKDSQNEIMLKNKEFFNDKKTIKNNI